MKPRLILKSEQFKITIHRLCHQLIENHHDFSESVLIGLQPRGIFLAKRIQQELTSILKNKNIALGHLDVTFYRDDFRKKELIPEQTKIEFTVEDKKVILIDDVLYTGRTIRAGLDAIMDFGRPRQVELLVFIDRKYSRHLPIQPDYVGQAIDSISSEKVKVEWQEADGKDNVWLVEK